MGREWPASFKVCSAFATSLLKLVSAADTTETPCSAIHALAPMHCSNSFPPSHLIFVSKSRFRFYLLADPTGRRNAVLSIKYYFVNKITVDNLADRA